VALLVKRDHDKVNIQAAITTTGAVSSTNTDAVRLPGMVNAIVFVCDVSAAATDAGDTLDIKVQTKIDGTNWVDVIHFTQILGNGGAKRFIAKLLANTAETLFADAVLAAGTTVRHLLGDEWRINYVQVDADANSSFTWKVTACPM